MLEPMAQIALLSLRPAVLLIPGTSSVRHLGENFAVSEIESGQQARNELAACGLAAKDRWPVRLSSLNCGASSSGGPASSHPAGELVRVEIVPPRIDLA